MDKNTLLGLVLMAAVMFGFMWWQQPSAEQIAAEKARREAAQTPQTETNDNTPTLIDSLSAAERASLPAAVQLSGKLQPDGSYVYTDACVSLKGDSTGVTGTVKVDSLTVGVADLLAGRDGLDYDRHARATRALRAVITSAEKYKGFSRFLGGEAETVKLGNDVIDVTISTRGAMVSQVELLKYKTELTEEPSNILLFRGDNDGYGFLLTTAEQRFDTREFNFTTSAVTDTTVTMMIEPAPGAKWGIRYTLLPGEYVVKMEVIQQGMDAVLPASTAQIEFDWQQRMGRNEKGRTFEERNSGIFYQYVDQNPDELNANKNDSEEIAGRIKWVAFKNQFFSSVIVANDYFSTANLKSVVLEKSVDYLKDLSMTSTLPYTAANGVAASFDFFFGPNDYPLLSSLDKRLSSDHDLKLTRLIPLGWPIVRWINTLIIIPVFDFLGRFISNYGVIILLLTLFIKLILFPFTFKSYKGQARMRLLAPEIKEINDRWPGQENAMKRQQETMALYSRAGASPFSGCLPMLLQWPVLIAMFWFFPSAIELRGQSFLWAHDLSAPDVICTLPFSIPFYGNHVSLFCLLMTAVNIIYSKINMQSQPTSSSMPGMKWMMYLMPVMFLFFFNDYASALSYYYFLSLLLTIVQTWLFRKCINEDKVRAEMLANAKKPRKKSGLMARLEAAQKQQQAMMREQAKRNARR